MRDIVATCLVRAFVGHFISMYPNVGSHFYNVCAKSGITPLNEGSHDGIKKSFVFVSRNLHGASHGLPNEMKGCEAIGQDGHVRVGGTPPALPREGNQ